VGVQSQNGHSAARDAKAREAKVKIALLAQYSSKTRSTIDLSPVPTPGVGHGRAWRQSLIRDLIEPVQSDETKSALGSHVQEFAFSGDVPGFHII
jgi:hypothetical protein